MTFLFMPERQRIDPDAEAGPGSVARIFDRKGGYG